MKLHISVAGLYNSALFPPSEPPPTSRTFPLGSSDELPKNRELRFPVKLHVPVPGSYSSALLPWPTTSSPAVTRTFPLGSSVAAPCRAVLRLLVLLHVLVAGSYSSALLRLKQPCSGQQTNVISSVVSLVFHYNSSRLSSLLRPSVSRLPAQSRARSYVKVQPTGSARTIGTEEERQAVRG